jgi:hypothetical protein
MQFRVSVYRKAGSRDPRMQIGNILDAWARYPGRRGDPGIQGEESWNAGSGILECAGWGRYPRRRGDSGMQVGGSWNAREGRYLGGRGDPGMQRGVILECTGVGVLEKGRSWNAGCFCSSNVWISVL